MVRNTLKLNHCTKLFHQNSPCFERHIVGEALYKCGLLLFEDPASLAPACGSQGLSVRGGHFGRCAKASPLRVNTLEK